MMADRYLRWCVSGYEMESASFTALKNQVDRVRNLVINYDGVVESVKEAQRTLGKEYTGYSRAVRQEVDDVLHTAQYCLGNMCEREELKKELTEARRLLDKAKACEDKGREVAAPAAVTGAVKGSEKDANDGRTFKLLWEGWVSMGFDRRWVELRLYGDQIERWIEGEKDTVLSETIARQLYPKMKTAEAAMTGGGAQLLDMNQLLRRMQDVRECMRET
jgi:hypothetical protein